MNPSNANNKTLFTPESAEAKLADMQQRVLAKYTGPDATQPITGAGCDASINECEHWLRVEGQVDERVLVKRTLLVEGYVNEWTASMYAYIFGDYLKFRESGGMMEFGRSVCFEENYSLFCCHVDALMCLQASYVMLGDVDA